MRPARQAPAPKPPKRMVKPPGLLDGQKKKPQKPKHNCCDRPDPKTQDDGSLVCMSCYREITEASQIVSEVQFSEDAGGKATAQGSYINNDARHANTLGAGARRLGGNDRDAGQTASANAKRILNGLCPRLSLSENIKNQAVMLYQLASGSNFSAGRRTEEVVAACLYAVCRRDPNCQVLLIDISELQRINVFRLGEVYKALCKDVYLPQSATDRGVGTQNRLEIESLIMKYCRKLEFGDKTRQVAEDAVRILKRMRRDWIVTGRHPAGLCGACIIYAARMNNFRRTKREVVYVAKIADQTVALRMKEFQRTRAAEMSVEEFRAKGMLVKETHNPPAFVKNREKEAKAAKQKEKPKGPMPWSKKRRQMYEIKKAKRLGKPIPTFEDEEDAQMVFGDANAGAATRNASQEADNADDNGDGPRKRQRISDGSPAATTPPPTQQEPRLDEDGFTVPTIPASIMRQQQRGRRGQSEESEVEIIDLEGEGLQPKKRGRKPKEIWTPTAEELMGEQELENEIQGILAREEEDDGLREAQEKLDQERAKEREEEARRRVNGEFDPEEEKEREKQRDRERAEASRYDEKGYDVNDWQHKDAEGQKIYHEEITAEMLEAEFADDPEVENCKLPERDRKIKEQIWVAENEDWMRVQVAKEINKRLNNENKKDKTKGAKPGRRKKGRMGDGSTIAEATTPIETPLDANRAMFERRGMPKGISKHINYEALKNAYKQRSSSSRDTSEAPTTRDASVAASETSTRELGSPTPGPESDREQTQRNTVAEADGSAAHPTPAATQDQATAGAEQTRGDGEDEEEDDPNDYNNDNELDYGGGSDDEGDGRGGWLNPDEDDEGDAGFDEDDEYGPMSRASLQPHGDEESFF